MTERRGRGRPPHDDQLTPAEWRVVEWVRHGLTNRAIARLDGTSVDAVKFHVANTLAKLGFADRRALMAWDGSRRESAIGRYAMGSAGSELGMIGQVARSTSDIAVARRFYGDVMGLPHLYSFGDLAFFDCGGTRLLVSQGDRMGPDSILYFRVGDIRGAQVALTARGVSFTHAPHMVHRHDDGTEEWMAFFADPDGQPLAIMAQVRAV